MATIRFTNSLTYTRTFTETDLISILTNLNGNTNYFTNGLHELGSIRISSGAVLYVVMNSRVNMQLLEIYSFQYSVSNSFNIKHDHNGNAIGFNIDAALLSVGYIGTVQSRTLERVCLMTTYTNHNQTFLLAHDIVKHSWAIWGWAGIIEIISCWKLYSV